MTVPSFAASWRGDQRQTPPICVLEVRDRAQADPEPIALLFVERREVTDGEPIDGRPYAADFELAYETIPADPQRHPRVCGSFRGRFRRGEELVDDRVSLTGGTVFLDPEELRGQRIGTYLMNEIVCWAGQWPHANVQPIQLEASQADEDNKERRNRFYERFGLEFDYVDATKCAGRSRPIRVGELRPIESWRQNIAERDVPDVVSGLRRARDHLERELVRGRAGRDGLARRLQEADDHPLRWALRRLWWRCMPVVAAGAVLVGLSLIAWLRYGA